MVDIIHNKLGYKDIPLVFVDVPTQYPQLKDFVLSNYDNVTVVKPSISFIEVCKIYGFPLVSKEVSLCVMCGFGCHLEKEPNRFQKLAESHPSYLKLLDICKNNDVTMREAIEWCNEHINRFHIELPPKEDK